MKYLFFKIRNSDGNNQFLWKYMHATLRASSGIPSDTDCLWKIAGGQNVAARGRKFPLHVLGRQRMDSI